MSYKYIFFDLDGTLTDPKKGITKSVAYSLKKMKNIDVDIEYLTKFIGPPLKESYMEYYSMSESEADWAIEYFREYFTEAGIFENEIYEGIEKLLQELKAEGYELMVATSKPTVFADRVLEHFKIQDYFSHIVGSNLDGTRTKKAEVIEEVLRRASIIDKNSVLMIGDRKHDIVGAKQLDIDSIGVVYGYGSREELIEAGAKHVVDTLGELKSILV